jgi:transcription elongation factor GreA
MAKFPITLEGFARLEEELKQLKTIDRPSISKAISEARELGDLSENAEYHAAREKQSFIEGRIIELEDKFAKSEIIDISKLSGNVVRFGAKVHLLDEDSEKKIHYQIVGEYEADLDKGLISLNSPLARALIGKSKGDSVDFNTPGGNKSYEILAVQY